MSELSQLGSRYELDRVIGRGPTATVYRALDRETGHTVAVKILQARYGNDPRFAVRFREHFRRLAGLRGDHIVPVHDYGRLDGHYYVVMPLVEGPNLGTYLATRGPISPPEAVAIARQACAAVEAAHQNGVVACGLKPQNILLTADGHVQVTDLGFNRVSSESGLSKTRLMLEGVPYMSPEQARGEPVGPASDVYSLGVVLFQMLTGRLPFEGRNAWSLVRMQAGELPPSPRRFNRAVPGDLAAVALRALQRTADKRYPMASEMALDLAAVGVQGKTLSRPPLTAKSLFGLNLWPLIQGARSKTGSPTPGIPALSVALGAGVSFYIVIGALVAANILFGPSGFLLRSLTGWAHAFLAGPASEPATLTVPSPNVSSPEWFTLSGFEAATGNESDHGQGNGKGKNDNNGKNDNKGKGHDKGKNDNKGKGHGHK